MPKKEQMTKPDQVFLLQYSLARGQAIDAVSKLEPDIEAPPRVVITYKKEARRNKQNRLSFMWYKELGAATGEGHVYWRQFCKLNYGIPILRVHEEANDYITRVLDPLPYESKLFAMEHIDVSSLFTVREFAEYLNDIDFAAGALGVKLTHPDDLYWDSLMKTMR